MKSVGETLSSNTLFHFTSQRAYIENIIESGFYPRYSTEDFSAFAPSLGQAVEENQEFGVPMVCFCDIPLSKVKEHISVYKGYGIGCNKDWGIAKGISPLIYIDPNSETALAIKEMLASLLSLTAISEADAPIIRTIREKLIWLVKFTKPYEGRFEHGGEVFEKKRFYDEREWRYVPKLPNLHNSVIAPWISKQELIESIKTAIKIVKEGLDVKKFIGTVPWVYKSAKKDPSILELSETMEPLKIKDLYDQMRNEMNSRIANEPNLRMTVDPTSIKYIIVEKEEDIMPIIKVLDNKFGNDYSQNTMIRLKARVITLDQIQQDF